MNAHQLQPSSASAPRCLSTTDLTAPRDPSRVHTAGRAPVSRGSGLPAQSPPETPQEKVPSFGD